MSVHHKVRQKSLNCFVKISLTNKHLFYNYFFPEFLSVIAMLLVLMLYKYNLISSYDHDGFSLIASLELKKIFMAFYTYENYEACFLLML